MVCKRLICVMAGLAAFGTAMATPSVRPQLYPPPDNMWTLDYLWKATLTTSGGPVTVYLYGYIESEGRKVVSGYSKNCLQLQDGTRRLVSQDIKGVRDLQYEKGYQAFTIRGGTPPAGVYKACVEVHDSASSQKLGVSCFEDTIRLAGAPRLMSPKDGAALPEAQNQPLFTWLAPSPKPGGGLTYDLTIVEVLPMQNALTAMRDNKPYFKKPGLTTTNFKYAGTPFQKGKKYAWQVKAAGAASEVWGFVVLPDEPPPLDLEPDSCENGGFEEGTFNKWTCYTASFPAPVLGPAGNLVAQPLGPWASSTSIPDRHDIMPKAGWAIDGFDPVLKSCVDISGNPTPVDLKVVRAGSRSVRLGSTSGMREASALSYEFDVPTSPGNLTFWYAVVVHDPLGASAYSRYTNVNTHPVGDYPFFSYDIAFRPANSNNWDAPSDPQPVAPPAVAGNGPFTNISPWSHSYNSNPDPAGIPTNPSRSVFYKNWSMDSVSLAGHGGERARITFRVVDCPWGQGSGQTASPGHYIYAYIDGLCGEDTSSTSQDSSAYCCPGENLVMNGNFELRDSLFSSDYRPVPGKGGIGGIGNVDSVSMGPGGRVVGVPEWTETPGGTPAPGGATTPAGLVNRMVESYRHASKYRPGCYAVVTSEKALEICDQWVVKDHSACTEGYSGSKFMVVNGRTQQTHPKKAVIWQQTVTVEKDSNYKFCAHVKNLAQCCFDMKPIVAVTIDPVTCIDWQTIDAGSGECDWQLLQKDFKATGTSVTIKILLYECLNGDGNDLAIDDISLQKVPPAPLASTSCTFSYSYPPGDENHFNLTFNQPPPPIDGGFDGDTAECGYYWTVCKIKPDGSIIDGSVVQNPSAWWTYPQSNTFAGYNSTSTLGDVSKPGLFDKNTLYRITYGVWCRCLTWNQSSWKVEWNPGKGAAGPTITPDTKYRPSPESIKKIMKDVEEQHKSR